MIAGARSTRRGLAHVGRSPKPGCRSNRGYRTEFMAPTLISLAQLRICRSWGSRIEFTTALAPSHKPLKDETPDCHRIQGRCQADTARCAATRGWQGPKRRRFDANSEDVCPELVGLLLVNYSSREHCVVIHAKKQSFSVKSGAISLSDAVRTTL